MEITKEQMQEYIQKNFDTFFVEGLAKYVKDVMLADLSKESIEEYREELKHLIWEAISHGVKSYLEEYNGEAVKIIASELVDSFRYKRFSIVVG